MIALPHFQYHKAQVSMSLCCMFHYTFHYSVSNINEMSV